ncbi:MULTISPECIES: alpha/beta fold hydrolase [unclassified Tenacibaculum]|uniref:alpha/beta fold hydrolase n=1 Tax=unclassified Tenacibaculum TaxID=2635139 RepID=UPI001F354DCD|nr:MULTISPECIES: alpha/beta hydrolase [unclassified Tenacibaculum]MCF2875235.1 alpha/beta hydrolase [Tenacibaculum sp. Cn5-1]MCF2935311.1 alpha/beta hydrolase [Tenacibaculum sp. Cn5-34]MCG7511247.1 alpha/beta hydrolase [Tenacibaculum sp. Cn5-46]
MTGNIIDNLRYIWKSPPKFGEDFFYLNTDYGKIRVLDTKGNLPVIINVPDGPNVIEHQFHLIKSLSKDYRVICFEYPGLGFSFPNNKYDYSFESGANLLNQVMKILKLEKVSLLFSCSNGYYAIQAAMKNPDKFNHIFLSQTPSTEGLLKWTEKSIPSLIKTPFLGQLTNAFYAKKFAGIWYKYALPKESLHQLNFTEIAQTSIHKGGCFCLSSLVQGLKKDSNTLLKLNEVPTTLVWGSSDFTHRKTDKTSIKSHINNCEIIEFKDCGHFPELERTNDYVKLIKERIM